MLSSEFRRLFRSRQLYAALLAGFAAAFWIQERKNELYQTAVL